MTTLSQARPTADAKYAAFVEEQLGRAQRRIWALDALSATLTLSSLALAYVLIAALADNLWDLPPWSRKAGFVLFAGAVAAIGVLWTMRLARRINPYYAARQIEEGAPGAKNSVVNWLDLHSEPLPTAIHVAVTRRAAHDLRRVDLERAVSARRTAWLGGLLAGLLTALIVAFFILGPLRFGSLLDRALTPFSGSALSTRTTLRVVEPEGGNVTVPIGRDVAFAVVVDGRVPEPGQPTSIRLLYHYRPEEPYLEVPFTQEQRDRWGAHVPAADVGNGFWYKVAGGDAETPEYHVQVRSHPLLSRFEARYHYRPYLGSPDQTSPDPNLDGMRGTQVTLDATASCAVREGRLDFEVEGRHKSIPATLAAADPAKLRFKLVLNDSGSYRIWFVARDGEQNEVAPSYRVTVKTDQTPRVTLLQPAAASRAPANAKVFFEGVARDDFGLASLALRVALPGDTDRQARAYPYADNPGLTRDRHRVQAEYKQTLDLGSLRRPDGSPLKKGMSLRCWLEATDHCDSPGPNTGRSDVIEILLDDAQKEQSRNAEARPSGQASQQKSGESQGASNEPSGSGETRDKQANGSEASAQAGKEGPQSDRDLDQKIKQVDKTLQQQKTDQPGQTPQDEGTKERDGQSPPSGKGETPKNNQSSASKQGTTQASNEDRGNAQKGAEQSGATSKSQSKEGGSSQSQGSAGEPQAKSGNEQRSSRQTGQSAKDERPAGRPGQDQRGKAENGGQPAGKQETGEPQGGKEPHVGEASKREASPDQSGAKSGTKEGDRPPSAEQPGQDKQRTGAAQPNQGRPSAEQARSRKGEKEGQAGEGSQASRTQGNNASRPDTAPQERQRASQASGSRDQSATRSQPGQASASGEPQAAPGQQDQGGKASDSRSQKTMGPPTGQSGQPKSRNERTDPASSQQADDKKEQRGTSATQKGQESSNSREAKHDGTAGNSPNQKADSSEVTKAERDLTNPDKSKQAAAEKTLNDMARSHPDPDTRAQAQRALDRQQAGQKDSQAQQVAELARKLASEDSGEREQARKQLEDIAQKAQSEQARERAKEALQSAAKAGQPNRKADPDQSKPGEKGSGEGTQKQTAQRGQPSPQPGPNGKSEDQAGEQPGNSAQGGQRKEAPKASSSGNEPAANKNQPAPQGGQPQGESGKSTDPARGEPGTTAGLKGDRRSGEGSAPVAQEQREAAPDATAQRKAGELQLEDYRRKLTKDVLKDLKWSEADKENFLKALRERAQRQAAGGKPEQLGDPRRQGGMLPSISAERARGNSGQPDDVTPGGPAGQPPRQFREAAKDWSEKVQELERSAERKPPR